MNSVIASLIAEWYGETNILGISFVQWSDLFLIFVSQPGGGPHGWNGGGFKIKPW